MNRHALYGYGVTLATVRAPRASLAVVAYGDASRVMVRDMSTAGPTRPGGFIRYAPATLPAGLELPALAGRFSSDGAAARTFLEAHALAILEATRATYPAALPALIS